MEFKLTVFSPNDQWIDGTIGDYNFTAKHFDEGSEYGIEGGRVSKLEIWKGEYNFNDVLVNYDRGWDQKPETSTMINVYNELMNHLENLPKRFEND